MAKLYGDFDVLNAHCLLNSSTVISKCASTVIRFFFVLFFCFKNILGHRKRPKIFYVNIILQRKFWHFGWLPATNQHFPSCCCPYVYPCKRGSL